MIKDDSMENFYSEVSLKKIFKKKITLTITHLFLYTVKYIQYNKYK